MAAAASCAVMSADLPAAQRAAAWARRFHPDVTVTLDAGAARLSSDERGEDALRLIWQCSLLNEKLLDRGAGRRAAVLEALVG
jgi:hypothetical protein